MRVADKRFFYFGPTLLNPISHLVGVTLPRLAGWFLNAPIQRTQNLPHMTGVKGFARDPLNNCRHSRQSPQFCVKAVLPRTLTQCSIHFPELLDIQARFTSGAPGPTQLIRAAPSPPLVPPAHTLPAYLQSTRHPRLRFALRK